MKEAAPQLRRPLLVHRPRNKNAQKHDSDRQQHPVLDRHNAQDDELRDEPVHEASPHLKSYLKAISFRLGWLLGQIRFRGSVLPKEHPSRTHDDEFTAHYFLNEGRLLFK
jgi:hypothetical protein